MSNHSVLERPSGTVMVVGGGIGGMRSALDLADAGIKVYLIEQTACLGGRVAQLGYMFPQHDCVLCRGTPDHGYGCTRPSISPAYAPHNQHPNIEIFTNTQVHDVAGQGGEFTVSLRQEPRYVDVEHCISCGLCAEVCPDVLPDPYQQNLGQHKAAHKVAARAIPDAYVIDKGPMCDECGACIEVCPTDAINLQEQPRLLTLDVSAIILALGFQIYDATEIEELGYGRYPNVLNAMEYERLASRSGPTEGVVHRPSDKQQPKSIAWLQCIGSRDQNNSYCSSICCMYATKEAMLAKQRLGEDTDCCVFIMDERAFNKEYSTYFAKAREKHGIRYVHCRISSIQEDPETRDLLVEYADPSGTLHHEQFETVVLATGVQPPSAANSLARMLDIELNEYGFCQTDKFTPLQTSRPGVFVCGAFSSPKEIAETIIDASGAAGEVMRLLNDSLGTNHYTREYPFLSQVNVFPPERDVSSEAPAVGVFLCSCASTIEQVIDLNALQRTAESWSDVAFVEKLDFACFPEAQPYILSRIHESGVNRVVVAACSNRTHEALFQRTVRQAGLNPYLLELVNLREQCSMVHPHQPRLANRKAAELTRMAVGRVIAAQPVQKVEFTTTQAALVIGGGASGMTAALAIADSGYDVHLIERAEMLGGNLLNLYYVAEGYDPQRLMRDLVNRVRTHKRIDVHTRTEVLEHTGRAGHFRALLRTRGSNGNGGYVDHWVEHGATIIATGGYETEDHPLLHESGVMTQRELEAKIIHHPEEIAALRDVVMIQCMKPADVPEYCSRVCCTNTLKNAIRIKLTNPKCNVTVLYKNIVTYGFREKYFTEARKLGVVFIRYTNEEPPEVITENGHLSVRVRDLSLDRMLTLKADIVPMSMAIVPADGTDRLADVLRVERSSEGFIQDAQLKLRPMDILREGVFLAGMAHYPKFIEESISHALSAAGRAITLLSQPTLHLGGVVAQVDPDLCVGCLTCTRTCPFAIPQVLEQEGRHGVGGLGGAAYIDPTQCQGCGTCTGECPANAIQLVHYTDEQMMLRNIKGLGHWLPVDAEEIMA